MKNKTIVITGGTGFIGQNLAHFLTQKGYKPIIIARNHPTKLPYEFLQWDARTEKGWYDSLEGALAVVNLAGRTVDCIKTPDHCDEILRSRVESTLAIGKALRKVKNPPKIWVQMSTAHIYGDPPKLICEEDAATGYGLAPMVGKAWEEAYQKAVLPDMKQVILRTSFVLGKAGGALPQLMKIVKWGLGGKVGHGQQGFSWIHEKDLNALILRGIESDKMEGIYNISAPNPVSNKEFMRLLRKALKVPIGLPTPTLMATIGAFLFFKTDPELALYGRYVRSKRLENEGFQFKYPALAQAFDEICNNEQVLST
ncbi:MAG: TIGR01777 family oxidoreductase [Bacteroidota bacterium]